MLRRRPGSSQILTSAPNERPRPQSSGTGRPSTAGSAENHGLSHTLFLKNSIAGHQYGCVSEREFQAMMTFKEARGRARRSNCPDAAAELLWCRKNADEIFEQVPSSPLGASRRQFSPPPPPPDSCTIAAADFSPETMMTRVNSLPGSRTLRRHTAVCEATQTDTTLSRERSKSVVLPASLSAAPGHERTKSRRTAATSTSDSALRSQSSTPMLRGTHAAPRRNKVGAPQSSSVQSRVSPSQSQSVAASERPKSAAAIKSRRPMQASQPTISASGRSESSLIRWAPAPLQKGSEEYDRVVQDVSMGLRVCMLGEKPPKLQVPSILGQINKEVTVKPRLSHATKEDTIKVYLTYDAIHKFLGRDLHDTAVVGASETVEETFVPIGPEDILRGIIAQMQEKRMRIIDLFREIDEDCNNSVSIEELRIALSKMFGIEITDDIATQLARLLDTDNNGSVSFEELRKGLVEWKKRAPVSLDDYQKCLEGLAELEPVPDDLLPAISFEGISGWVSLQGSNSFDHRFQIACASCARAIDSLHRLSSAKLRRRGVTLSMIFSWIWVGITEERIAQMLTWVFIWESEKIMRPAPPLISQDERRRLEGWFDDIDSGGNGYCTPEQFVNGSIKKNPLVQALVSASTVEHVLGERIDKRTFVELMCPDGYRAYEDSAQARHENGGALCVQSYKGIDYKCWMFADVPESELSQRQYLDVILKEIDMRRGASRRDAWKLEKLKALRLLSQQHAPLFFHMLASAL